MELEIRWTSLEERELLEVSAWSVEAAVRVAIAFSNAEIFARMGPVGSGGRGAGFPDATAAHDSGPPSSNGTGGVGVVKGDVADREGGEVVTTAGGTSKSGGSYVAKEASMKDMMEFRLWSVRVDPDPTEYPSVGNLDTTWMGTMSSGRDGDRVGSKAEYTAAMELDNLRASATKSVVLQRRLYRPVGVPNMVNCSDFFVGMTLMISG
jgi:hypothetical protein